MSQNLGDPKPLNMKWRKIVHYSLLFSILLIQIAIATFFYNEYVNRKKLSFIETQLESIRNVENLTKDSKKELYTAQDFLRRYTVSEDSEYLQSYFDAMNKFEENLVKIKVVKRGSNTLVKNIVAAEKKLPPQQNFKMLIDSTYQYTKKSDLKESEDQPKLKKIEINFDFDIPEIKTQTFSDTIAKKGIIGRLKDAISGKENVRKDSIVVTVQNKAKPFSAKKLQAELDSVINSVNNQYYVQIEKIQFQTKLEKAEHKNDRIETTSMYSNLLDYGNDLMNVYENAVSNSKFDLEKELASLNSKGNIIRNYLMAGLMALMFIVSILIMYLTRVAFMYEKKLKIAAVQISENLNFKNRILGMLSHELRSPLKIIEIFIKKINSKTEDAQIKEYLKSISFTNNTLFTQANQILEYTKNQQVKNKLIPTFFNLKNEIDSILTAIKPYIETRNNTFLISAQIDSNFTVFSDATKINQIYINILANANKFTENGEISVHTSAKKIDDFTVSFVTNIKDTGAGISKSDLKEIFEPYYQGVLSDEVDNLGAGLGLSLCKEIVELFDGTISVESDPGSGTSVRFTLNLKLVDEPEK